MLSAGELAEYPRCARTVALSTVCFVYACAVRDTHVFSTGVNETWRALCRFKSECRQKQSDFRQSDSAFVRLNCGARIATSSYVPRNGDVVRAPRDFVARGSLPWTSRRLKESAASGCRVDEASLQLRSLTSSTLCSGGVVRCRPTYDVVVDKVAVSLSLPRPPCDRTSRLKSRQADRGPLLSTCREPTAGIRPTLRFMLRCRSLCFCWPFQLPLFIFFQLLTCLSSKSLLIIDSLLIVDNNDLIYFSRQHFVE